MATRAERPVEAAVPLAASRRVDLRGKDLGEVDRVGLAFPDGDFGEPAASASAVKGLRLGGHNTPVTTAGQHGRRNGQLVVKHALASF
jgi:hypothetical protein